MSIKVSKTILAGTIIALLAANLPAQEQWVRRYGMDGSDRAYAMALIPDGYMLTGRTTSFSELSCEDAFLLKVEPDGDTTWWKRYGGEYDERAYAIDVTSDGGYIIAGFAEAVDTADADVYVVKTDAQGNEMWSKSYGGAGQDTAFAIIETSDGTYLAAGYTSSFGAGGADIWLLKMNSSGDTLWTRTYGGAYDDQGHGVVETADGGYLMAGSTASFWEDGEDEVYLIKTDTGGNLLWEKVYGGIYDDAGYAVSPTADSGFIITGATWSFGSGLSDVWLLKIDSEGDTLWTNTFGGTNYDEGFSVRETSDGGYIITGYTQSFGMGREDVYLVKTDAWGESQWTRTYGADESDIGYAASETSDGGYVVAGRTRSFGAVRCDIYILKTDEQGSVAVREEKDSPEALLIKCIEPNPFSDKVLIRYQLLEASNVLMEIYDPTGRKMTTLMDGHEDAGTHEFWWNGDDAKGVHLGCGVYFLRFDIEGFTGSERLIMLR